MSSPEALRPDALTSVEVARMLEVSTCYDLLPESGKIIVFDVGVPIRLALFALVEHEVDAAFLWDSGQSSFSGTISTTDFVDLLLQFHESKRDGESSSLLAEHTLEAWRGYLLSRGTSGVSIFKIHPDAPLLDACTMLLSPGVHRLAVVEDEETEDRLESAVRARENVLFSEMASVKEVEEEGGKDEEEDEEDGREVGLDVGGRGDEDHRTSSAAAAEGEEGREKRKEKAARQKQRLRDREGRGPRTEVTARDGRLEDVPAPTRMLGMVTQMSILSFLADNLRIASEDSTTPTSGPEKPISASDLFPMPLQDTQVGSWGERLLCLPYDTPLIHVLAAMREANVAAIPLVDRETGELVDLWAREDTLFLTNDPSLDCLDLPVHVTRRAQLVASGGATSLRVCRPQDPLGAVLDTLTAARVRRVVVVDPDGKPVGIVALSDIFEFIARIQAPTATLRARRGAAAAAGD